ncbi:OsmC family protein [Lacinutrix sp. MedPE-SW]|uniref:OsmC family protein n=1 Tax=Lacinutrix sp. MedPE-SW TaxID=1860087 RepID=UPI0009213549|nr:OsmC family protein [Lacinutrix sp. MedPE-SW]OIQ23409.1 MAG: osmotically inducible protein OsmC [Lacinutrix sp. MedPE-SW]
MSHKVTTVWKEKMIFESDNPSGYSFNLGVSEEENDPYKSLRPKAAMLSSLAACSGLDVVSVTEKMKTEFSDFKIEVSGELTDEHPKTYHTVTVDYHFYGKDLNEKKIKKAVDLSIEKYCGVMEMFRQFATVNTKIHYHSI